MHLHLLFSTNAASGSGSNAGRHTIQLQLMHNFHCSFFTSVIHQTLARTTHPHFQYFSFRFAVFILLIKTIDVPSPFSHFRILFHFISVRVRMKCEAETRIGKYENSLKMSIGISAKSCSEIRIEHKMHRRTPSSRTRNKYLCSFRILV